MHKQPHDAAALREKDMKTPFEFDAEGKVRIVGVVIRDNAQFEVRAA
jgi:hypothetical protein